MENRGVDDFFKIPSTKQNDLNQSTITIKTNDVNTEWNVNRNGNEVTVT